MLGKRIVSAAILIPIVVIAVYLGELYFLGLVVLVGVLAGIEYLRMMRAQQWTPSYLFGLLLIVLCILDGQWPRLNLLSIGMVGVPLLALTVEVFRGNAQGSLLRWSLMVAGAVYIGCAASYFVRLRALEGGIYWLALALLGTWTCDTGAYFAGVTWGRTPFFPQISPKKTWEGALGGLVAGIVLVSLLGWLTLRMHPVWGGILGVLLVLGATFGDLAESVIKRQVGAKDSGRLIPGHGGMLDRVDSLLFVTPIVYYFAITVGRLIL